MIVKITRIMMTTIINGLFKCGPINATTKPRFQWATQMKMLVILWRRPGKNWDLPISILFRVDSLLWFGTRFIHVDTDPS
mmetsp:Transcript_43805/g.47515  ORF Transcript_43805/g.47515 Transcript_43805/m.47515 type:complete len:80 (+) Transcript_43805:1277-1516(+)